MIKIISCTTPELNSLSSEIIEELDSAYTINDPSRSPAYSLKSFVLSDPDYPDAEFNIDHLIVPCKYKDEDTGKLYYRIYSVLSVDGANDISDPVMTYTEDCDAVSLIQELSSLQDTWTFEKVIDAYMAYNKGKEVPEKDPEGQDKLYHLVYQRHNSKDVYEEIIEERFLLHDKIGPLRFIESDWDVSPAEKMFLSNLDDFIHNGDTSGSLKDLQDSVLFLLNEWKQATPTYIYDKPLDELLACQWLDKSGVEHLVIEHTPFDLVDAVFDQIKDADRLTISEVSRQEAKKIEERLDQAKENRRAGLGRL